MNVLIGVMIPFLGTLTGSAMVFFMKDSMNVRLEKLLLGFAGGVMMAASVWSLLLPALDMSAALKKLAFLPAALGFLLGMLGLLCLDEIVPHLHLNDTEPEGMKMKLKKTTMMILAVTLHNLPEGMAVGVVFAGLMSQNTSVSLSGALALSIGIAIQNFPEGAIISMPLKAVGESSVKAFVYGALSGAVEPVGALLMIALSRLMMPFMPYMLSFAAGAMVYVIVEELIPEASVGSHSNIATVGFAIGFVVMMVLDVALG